MGQAAQKTYEVTAPDGRKFKMTGDHVPTEAELQAIFKQLPPAAAPANVAAPAAAADDPLKAQLAAAPPSPVAEKVTQFGRNVVDSSARLVKDTAVSLLNVINPDSEQNTIANLGKLAIGAAQKLSQAAGGTISEHDYTKVADAVGQHYKNRYGSLAKLAETAYTDPAGVASDLIGVAAGGAGLLRGAARASVPGAARAAAAVEKGLNLIPSVPKPHLPINPAFRSQVETAFEQDLPIGLAEATGNRYVRGLQRGSGESLLGSWVASGANKRQVEKFQEYGRGLLDPTAPDVDLVGAGQSLETSLSGAHAGTQRTQRREYGTVEAIEAEPANVREVPKFSPAQQAKIVAAREEKMIESLQGDVPTAAELDEIGRIRAELDSFQYQKGGLVMNQPGNPNLGQTYQPGHAGAPVYHDILQVTKPGTPDTYGVSGMTSKDMVRSLDRALEKGSFTNAAKAALQVARERLAGTYARGKAQKAGTGKAWVDPIQATTDMALPVDLRAAKDALRPVYEEWLQTMPLTQREASPGFTALKNIIEGDDFRPLGITDKNLSAIKQQMGDTPSAVGPQAAAGRTASEGIAAKAVGKLETALDEALNAAPARGAEARAALDRGRAARRAQQDIEDLQAAAVKGEPAKILGPLAADKDGGYRKLSVLQQISPDQIPVIGNAVLDEMLKKVTKRGDFSAGAQGALAQWERLGSRTKALLFPDPQHLKNLDAFFTMAYEAAQNPNPSGTAWRAMQMGELAGLFTPATSGWTRMWTVGSPVMQAALRSPRLTRILVQGGKIPLKNKAAVNAWVTSLERARQEEQPNEAAPTAP